MESHKLKQTAHPTHTRVQWQTAEEGGEMEQGIPASGLLEAVLGVFPGQNSQKPLGVLLRSRVSQTAF